MTLQIIDLLILLEKSQRVWLNNAPDAPSALVNFKNVYLYFQ